MIIKHFHLFIYLFIGIYLYTLLGVIIDVMLRLDDHISEICKKKKKKKKSI